MRVLLDACVLFPTVMRETLLGAAREGAFIPLWSDRILEEWARATRKLPPGAEAIARVEIALMQSEWRHALVSPDMEVERSLVLPDADDAHVMAAAIAGKADVLLTLNRDDFPTRLLGRFGILRRDPDGLLVEFAHENPDAMQHVLDEVAARAKAASGRDQNLRAMLKRAGMPRLGKWALSQADLS